MRGYHRTKPRCNSSDVLAYVVKQERPTLIGRVAVEFHVGLTEAEEALEDLVCIGKIRRITTEEMKEYDLTWGYFSV